MFDAILSGGPVGEAPRESSWFGRPLGPPTFARLPGLRICGARPGCPALRLTWLFLLSCYCVLSGWPVKGAIQVLQKVLESLWKGCGEVLDKF